MTIILRYVLTVPVFFSLCLPALAQSERTQQRALTAFNQRAYARALPLFEELYAADPDDAGINYGLGVCRLEALNVNERADALAPLELAAAAPGADVPLYVHYHLARAYHQAGRYADAVAQLDSFMIRTDAGDNLLPTTKLLRQQCRNGIKLAQRELPAVIMNAGATLNSSFTEMSPLINADNTTLIYTAVRPDADKQGAAAHEAIYSAQGSLNDWHDNQRLDLGGKQQVGAVAVSPDGQSMLLYDGSSHKGDLFQAELRGTDWEGPLPLEVPINSRHRETGASLSADGQTIYFASDRPGGYGGLDLWSISRDARSQWGRPRNLGPSINTEADEAAPFIHPDGRTLYFHADGARSVGGLDILKSHRVGDEWQPAQNLGMPINTPFDDAYFVITPDGTKGYFASDRPGGYGSLDLYFVGIPEEMNMVPLTMLKGRVLSGSDRTPVRTDIQIYDRATKQPIPHVYTSNATTGHYLMIFPPGREYEMYLEAEGYQPQIVTIKVPRQEYFYELYQEILLMPIMQFDALVGQAVSVRNAFEDGGQPRRKVTPDPKFIKEAELVQDSLDVFELVDNIIASEDSDALDYLLDLMFTSNGIEEVDFAEEEKIEVVSGRFYFEEREPGEVFALDQNSEAPMPTPTFEIDVTKVYFDVNRATLKPDFAQELDNIITAMRENPELVVRIDGYADATGSKETNKRLSSQRANAVLD
ncbi:MAG: OmpA family protein, partial [Catalinimonas sp.]